MVSLSYEDLENNRIENIKNEILELKKVDLLDYVVHKSRFFKVSRFTLSTYLTRLEDDTVIIIDRKKKIIVPFSEAEKALEINPSDICRICSQEIIGEANRYIFNKEKEINLHKSCFQVAQIQELKELYRLSNE